MPVDDISKVIPPPEWKSSTATPIPKSDLWAASAALQAAALNEIRKYVTVLKAEGQFDLDSIANAISISKSELNHLLTDATKISLERLADVARGLGLAIITSVQPISHENRLRRGLEHLSNMNPGDVWTEYHVSNALQLLEDFETLMKDKNVG